MFASAYMGRKRWAKPRHCSSVKEVTGLTNWYSAQWRREPAAAYAELVMGHRRKRSTQAGVASQMGLLALLFALLVTQAASSVCGAQCVEHQLPSSSSDHAMNHCRSMMIASPAAAGSAVQTCLPGVLSSCAVDLLANNQAKAVVLVSSPAPTGTLLSLRSESSPPLLLPLRSSPGSSPRITALRI
jgi:hypothetical protein